MSSLITVEESVRLANKGVSLNIQQPLTVAAPMQENMMSVHKYASGKASSDKFTVFLWHVEHLLGKGQCISKLSNGTNRERGHTTSSSSPWNAKFPPAERNEAS